MKDRKVAPAVSRPHAKPKLSAPSPTLPSDPPTLLSSALTPEKRALAVSMIWEDEIREGKIQNAPVKRVRKGIIKFRINDIFRGSSTREGEGVVAALQGFGIPRRTAYRWCHDCSTSEGDVSKDQFMRYKPVKKHIRQ